MIEYYKKTVRKKGLEKMSSYSRGCWINIVDPNDEEVEFFDLHIVSDEIHGERGFQIVLEHANTLELQSKCLKICEIGAEMRLLYTTALFNDYVKNDLSLEELETAA